MEKTTKKHINRKMNNDTYKLRREVINYIYRAKKLLNGNMQRVDIRITDLKEEANQSILGTARMNKAIIWIPANTLTNCSSQLHQVVFHELVHALYGVGHIEGCVLMNAILKKGISAKKVDEAFIKYARKRLTK